MNKNINLGGSADKPQILENIIILGDNKVEKKGNLITRYVKSQYNLAAIEMPAMYDGVRNMICSVPATVLINHFEVPYARGPIANMEGYQRDFSKGRINKLADRLIKELISLPLSISVNILEANAFNLFKNGKFTYNPSMHKSLRVMDGQHRILGLKEAFRRVLESEETDENLSSAREHLEKMMLNVTVTNTERVEREIQIFVEINSNSKGVPVDVVLANNLKRRRLGDVGLLDIDNDRGVGGLMSNANILSSLVSDHDSVWYKRIKIPGNECDVPNVGLNSMAKYLKFISESSRCKLLSDDKKADFISSVFNAYWDGIKKSYPVFFKIPKDFAIQKAICADVWMRMWPMIVQWTTDNHNRSDIQDPSFYTMAIKKIVEACEGETSTGRDVDGADFWRVGGPIGSFSSEKGKSNLVRLLENNLTS
jgi:DGQHR domain-containing protein